MAGLIPEKSGESYAIQCFPLYSLLLATGKSRLHFSTLQKYLSFTTSKLCYKVVKKNEERRGTASRVNVGKLHALDLQRYKIILSRYFDVLLYSK